MAQSTRIYFITVGGDTQSRHLVRAPNRAQAVAHVVAATIRCEVATQEQLVALLPQVSVEEARAE